MKPIRLNLDIMQDTNEYIELMQGYDYKLECEMLYDGENFDLTGYIPRVEMLMSNGNFIIQATHISVKDNIVTVELDSDFTNESGEARIQIVLEKEGKITGSWTIYSRIKQGALYKSKDTKSKADITEELIKTVNEAVAVKEETENLIATGGAATKGDIASVNEQLDTITPYKTEFINVILIGCDNTGVNDCTSILQEYIDNGYSLFFPEGKYKCNLIMKPQITLCGEGLGLVTLIPNNKNVDVIKADLSVYNYTIKDLTIDGLNTMGTQSYTGHGIYLSNEGSLAQQDLEPHLENIKIVNVIDGLKVDEGVRGGLFKNIKAGACVIGINHLSTDCIFTDCVTAQTQKHGIFILKSNNTLVSCKAFIAGLGKVEGAGIKVQGSYNRVINCESQQNVFECLHLQNANSNIIQGCILDGSGYNSKTWFPDLTYTETGGAVPISILRIYNSNSNIIDCTIINGRIDSYAKCGLYNQYVGSDSNNDIRLSITDTDTATTKPFTNYQLDDTNKYFKNNRVIINSTMMQNKSWLVPSVMNNYVEILGGGYIVKDGICYINLKFKGLNTYTWDNEVLQGLPVPLMDSISIASNLLDREIVIEGNKMIVRKGITTNSTYKVTACYIIK